MQDSEVEDVAKVDGITEDDVDDEEEDVVGDNKVPKEISSCYSDRVGIRRAST